MRVTQSMISTNVLKNLNKSYAELDKYFNQLNGKKITRPSEDPVVAMKGMDYRTELARVEQYQRNASELHNWNDNTDAALEQITSGLQRIRYLAQQASNDSYDEAERKSIAEEVEQIKLDLIDMANSKVNNKYIFNGTETDQAPITVNENGEIVYGQENSYFNNETINIEVSKGIKLPANVKGTDVFGELPMSADDAEGSNDVFSVIDRFIDKLKNNNEDGDMDASLTELDGVIDNVINARADLGARMNRLELVENRLEHQEVIATTTLSNNEDADFAETITKLITQQSLHRAALSSGSHMIQPTLMDFLR